MPPRATAKSTKRAAAARERESTSAAPAAVPVLRGKLWVEIDGSPAITEAGADLLEQIGVCESVSEAARRLRFSYRRAWMLVDAMNRRWHAPLVTKSVGGTHGGGTKLTELGQIVLRSYRDLQAQVEHLLSEASEDFIRSTRDRG